MHTEQMNVELRMQGMTREMGLSITMVTHVIHGHVCNKRMDEHIDETRVPHPFGGAPDCLSEGVIQRAREQELGSAGERM